MLAQGEVAKVVFEGEFVSGGLPTATTQTIPLGLLDLSYVLNVHVSRVIEGEIPGGWSTDVTFAVHSPAILFGSLVHLKKSFEPAAASVDFLNEISYAVNVDF